MDSTAVLNEQQRQGADFSPSDDAEKLERLFRQVFFQTSLMFTIKPSQDPTWVQCYQTFGVRYL